jgi:hypothetical protein
MALIDRQIGELMGRIVELSGVANAWKAKSEQQEKEIVYLRECLEKERTRHFLTEKPL